MSHQRQRLESSIGWMIQEVPTDMTVIFCALHCRAKDKKLVAAAEVTLASRRLHSHDRANIAIRNSF
jgi:hypothetical protein